MGAIGFHKISKSFGNTEVLREVDFLVEEGSFLILLGPSGCGKTTLLRLLAGLEEPSSGSISIDEVDITGKMPKDRDIAMVFQSYALYPHMSVQQNMEFGLKMRGEAKAQIAARVKEAAELLKIEHLLKRKPGELSGGQRQRVALGRALVRKPKVFLMDEPLSNLDAKLRAHMRRELAALHQKLKTTIVYVTHDQIEAMTMGTKVVLLNKSQIHQIGSPLELYEKPATAFVASFIGNPPMNLIDGEVLEEKGDCLFKFNVHQVRLPKDLAIRGPARLGIRPEHLRVGPRPQENCFSAAGEISAIERLGAENILDVRFGEEHLIIRQHNAEISENPGQSILVHWPLDKLHLFDSEGRRVELFACEGDHVQVKAI